MRGEAHKREGPAEIQFLLLFSLPSWPFHILLMTLIFNRFFFFFFLGEKQRTGRLPPYQTNSVKTNYTHWFYDTTEEK